MLFPLQNEARNRLDLSGIWDFRPDPDAVGEAEAWFNGFDSARPIAVPGSWTEQHADLFNYFGFSWYLKRVYVPAGWKGESIIIQVGSANYFAAVFVNGSKRW